MRGFKPRALVLAAAAAALVGTAADSRELDTSDRELLAAEVATVGVDRRSGAPVVLVRLPETGDVVPISVGAAQARAILLALRDEPVPRPMTHDLMRDMLESLDATLDRVIVDDLVDGTYLGVAVLTESGRPDPLRLDIRPSDGLALALRTDAEIELARRVVDKASDADFQKLGDGTVQALGVTVVAAEPELRKRFGLPEREGVIVSRVTGLARVRGLAVGDLVVAVNGEAPETPMRFLELVRETEASERVELTYWHDGSEESVRLPTDVPEPTAEQSI